MIRKYGILQLAWDSRNNMKDDKLILNINNIDDILNECLELSLKYQKVIDDIKTIKDEILIEIEHNRGHGNIGKKGCVRRLENILKNNP